METGRLLEKSKALAVGTVELVEALPRSLTGDVIGRQLLRCACSTGANYRAARRAGSRAEFIAKMGIVEEEADEVCYWAELLLEIRMGDKEGLVALMCVANEVVAVSVASIKTARRNREG